MFWKSIIAVMILLTLGISGVKAGDSILVEAEAFADHGGWKLDTQFIEIMGSPYLIAHGLGHPVSDATTTITVAEAGKWNLWVRTKDWVAPWQAEGAPGEFQLLIDGQPVETTFGTTGAEWQWEKGGAVELPAGEVSLSLHDLTGFNGRCDAIYLSQNSEAPDNSSEVLPAWRRAALGIEIEPIEETFDIVFVGGGYAGACGAISASRMGLKTALIQNRDVLGGNGSSEVRVWAKGNTPEGLFPVGEIVQQFSDQAASSPGTYEEYEDSKKHQIVEAEKNLSLFLGHHAFALAKDKNRVTSVQALETRTGKIREFRASYFCDSTGHGFLGILAGADRNMIDGGRMGMSNMWNWETTTEATSFPETPWALDLDEKGFPYPRRNHAEWFWESGYDKHPLNDLEMIRDWNLRANFGAWNAIKNKGAYARSDDSGKAHANAQLTWMAYIGGTRETLQLLGDVVLTEEDIIAKREFPDKCVLTTWSIDLHYPKEAYIGAFKDNPFISYAEHDRRIDRKVGYAVPYRCFYSRNIENLFMAGRNVSVTHKALGTVRVMKTGGMMGVVVGKAAAVAKKYDTNPRGVYENYLPELIELLKLKGNIRRPDIESPFVEDPAIPKYVPQPIPGSVPLSKLKGLVVDDEKANFSGKWQRGGRGLRGFVHQGYSYSRDPDATARYDFTIPEDGVYDVRMNWQSHKNRSKTTAVQVVNNGEVLSEAVINQSQTALMKFGFHSLGRKTLKKGDRTSVVVLGKGANGNIHVDAVQLLKK